MAADALVLRGRGGEVERDLSFGLVRDLFEPVLRAADPGARARWFSGAAGAAASVLDQAPGASRDAASVSFGLYWLLAAIADEQPVVLIADDLHACDPASLRWLAYLARRIEGLPVALLAATRPVEGDALLAIEGVRVIRPEALGLGATGELIADRAGPAPDPVFIEACLAASGGNPMLLRELVETMREEGLTPDEEGARSIEALAGDRLGRAVLGRIGRLEPAAAALARALSVLGDGSELRHAAELGEIDASAAVAALPALVAAGVLADEPALAFTHSLLRTAVYLELPAPVRAAEHRRAAALLHATSARPETVAHHLLLAEPVGEPWALKALREAAELAIGQGAPESAAAYLRRALEEPAGVEERAELRSLGNALVRLGEPAAVDVLEQALALTSSPRAQAAIVDASIDPLLARGRMGEARRLLLDVLEQDAVDPETRLTLMGRLALVHAHDATGDSRVLDGLREMTATLDASTPARRYAAAALALLHALREGTSESAGRLARIALDERSMRQADASSWRPLYVARVALALAGEPDEALADVEGALATSRARGSLMGQGLGLGWRALIHSLAGDVTAAENDGRASLALLSDTGLDAALQGAMAATAWALIERGQLDEADALLEQAPAPFGWGGSALACARVGLLIARHRYTEALIALAPVEQQGDSLGPWTWRSLAVSASLGNGDRDAARVLADEDLIEARRFGSARQIGSAMRVRAQIERGASGIALRGLAVEQLRGAGARLDLARALVDLGSAIRRGGERAASREPLLEGMELAVCCGASALVEVARTELRAAGARPRSVVRSGIDALTPSERRVCGLAAEGLANAEIAQALFVTVRTVEMHLSAGYRKLAISSRAELPRELAS